MELVCRRVPREVLEGTYAIRIEVREIEDGGTGKVGSEDFLSSYASEFSLVASRLVSLSRNLPLIPSSFLLFLSQSREDSPEPPSVFPTPLERLDTSSKTT